MLSFGTYTATVESQVIVFLKFTPHTSFCLSFVVDLHWILLVCLSSPNEDDLTIFVLIVEVEVTFFEYIKNDDSKGQIMLVQNNNDNLHCL